MVRSMICSRVSLPCANSFSPVSTRREGKALSARFFEAGLNGQQLPNLALDLAQTRYKLGLSSIVELSQAQLQQTDAQIGNSTARYDYLVALAQLKYQIGQ